ncbi:TPA: hypothetical protein LP602_000519 [Enterococcus faecium]|uniref:hypothetical protein n=1 Tax=Enterococcus faecium TaxID=1352 RepID=UPI001BAA4C3B|nr:hypothetical protein [Enterococcus faecium]QUM61509.1 hypothetical protein IUH69_13205 [Enterococcus faecium]QUM65208.1 hypothetical protein IUH68_05205 [Enterococcus faecium]HBL2405482.1 hypothetical protein [Enterococcus faecium]HBL2971834.1 hypothetical protein [Enterococcus faecium]
MWISKNRFEHLITGNKMVPILQAELLEKSMALMDIQKKLMKKEAEISKQKQEIFRLKNKSENIFININNSEGKQYDKTSKFQTKSKIN